MSEPILKAEHLGITFGGLKAVSDFNMTINAGELDRKSTRLNSSHVT